MRPVALRDDQDAGGVLVDAVHDPRTQLASDAREVLAVGEQRVDEGAVLVAGSRVHHHAGALVDHDDVWVFVQHLERDLLRLRLGRRGRGDDDGDGVASLQLERGLLLLAVHRGAAVVDEPCRGGPGEFGDAAGDKAVQPLGIGVHGES